MRTVVIGVGNPVRADDAVGLHVVREVRDRAPAGACDVDELWAGGLRLVEAMTGYDRAIVVDALAGDGVAPGELVRLGLDDLGACRTMACAHDTSLPTALALWRAAGAAVPREITMLGIGAEDLSSLTEELTPAVAAAVPRAVRLVLGELEREERA
jgi:hydrogenase maturation protease